MHIIISINS